MNQQPKVGILGGGQLGCMLADAALSLGLSLRVFAEASSPAAALFPEHVVLGATLDETALHAFFQDRDYVTFENEFLDCAVLERAAAGLCVRIAPGLNAIRELQDKLNQKEWLQKLGIPTAPFIRIEGPNPLSLIKKAFSCFPDGVAFKWSRMGYDGKGVLLADDTPQGRLDALEFCQVSLKRGVPVYAEQKAKFRNELALVASHSSSGEFAAYPLVLSQQRDGICYRVVGPATALGVHVKSEEQTIAHARLIADRLELTGSFAIELFEMHDGTLWVNEIAPRVHNSGHYSQDACPVSQFENHWRAILGRPLGETRPRSPFGMLNLLGPEGVALQLPRSRNALPFSLPKTPLQLHWYGKAELRPQRKVGHVNGLAATPNEIPFLEETFEKYHNHWQQELRTLASTSKRKQPS